MSLARVFPRARARGREGGGWRARLVAQGQGGSEAWVAAEKRVSRSTDAAGRRPRPCKQTRTFARFLQAMARTEFIYPADAHLHAMHVFIGACCHRHVRSAAVASAPARLRLTALISAVPALMSKSG